MNIEALFKLRESLASNKYGYTQATFVWDSDRYGNAPYNDNGECGTVCCLAGHVVMEQGTAEQKARAVKGDMVDWLTTAANILNMPYDTAQRLFAANANHWPEKYANMYKTAANWKEKREAAIALVDHLICKERAKLVEEK